jgi:hypothetical protein
MKVSEFLENHNIDKKKLTPMIAKAVRDEYPNLSMLSDHTLMQWCDFLELSDQDLNKLLIRISRYVKYWTFS